LDRSFRHCNRPLLNIPEPGNPDHQNTSVITKPISVERAQDTVMDPGYQQADCLSSTSSDSEDSPTTVPQITMPFAQVQADGKQTVSPPSSEGSEDGVVGSPITETYGDSDCEAGSQTSTVEYEQESFETYQRKVSQLCHDIGYGEPSKIERMKGGGYNRVIGLTLQSGQEHDYVLRIPRWALNEAQMGEIKDQVAVTLYLSRYDFLHVPVIAAFDTTVNNVLECQYVLQQRIDGTSIQDIFYTLPLSEKLQVARAVAEMLLQLESITLERPGRLVGTGELPARSDTAPASANEIKINGYRNNPMQDLPIMEKQPLLSLITSLLEIRKQKNLDWDTIVERSERLQAIAREMKALGLFQVTDNNCALWHWDLSAANIMIRRTSANDGSDLDQPSGPTTSFATNDSQGKWVVSGVLDWDDALSVPLVLARKPPSWLWLDEDNRGSNWVDDPDRDAKPERALTEDEKLIKGYFDEIMAEGSPSYNEDTYIRGPWLRALAEFAIYNFEDGIYWDKYDGFVKKWEEYYATRAFT